MREEVRSGVLFEHRQAPPTATLTTYVGFVYVGLPLEGRSFPIGLKAKGLHEHPLGATGLTILRDQSELPSPSSTPPRFEVTYAGGSLASARCTEPLVDRLADLQAVVPNEQ
jgi:hypothetical protein